MSVAAIRMDTGFRYSNFIVDFLGLGSVVRWSSAQRVGAGDGIGHQDLFWTLLLAATFGSLVFFFTPTGGGPAFRRFLHGRLPWSTGTSWNGTSAQA